MEQKPGTQEIWWIYQFPIGAPSNDHRVGGLTTEIYSVTVLDDRTPKSASLDHNQGVGRDSEGSGGASIPFPSIHWLMAMSLQYMPSSAFFTSPSSSGCVTSLLPLS